MGWFSKEKTQAECQALSKTLNSVVELPQECQKYPDVVEEVKKKGETAFKGALTRRATRNAKLTRQMTNSNKKN